MNHSKRMFFWSLVTAALGLIWEPAAVALEAGAHAVRLTLPPQTSLGGDSSRQGRAALGEHDPIWARCLFLDDGEHAVYLVTLDVHHIPDGLREQVVELADVLAEKDAIFLTATHTGNGPGGMEDRLPLRWSEGRFRPALLEAMALAALDAMQGAREAKQRATLGYGTTRQQVLSENANLPKGPIDEQIGVVRVDNADGQALAIISNFAALPRMVPESEKYHFSSDYPGAYYAAIESLSDPGCVGMFFPGACGSQRPVSPEGESGWAAVESVGRLLAVRAKEVANKMSFRDAKLKTYYREVPLPQTVSSAYLPASVVLQALKIDDLLLVFVPGMPHVELGLQLRKQMAALGFSDQFTVAVSNAYVGDIVPPTSFPLATPGSLRHYFDPDMADWVYDQIAGLVSGTAVEPPPTAPVPEATNAEQTTEITLNGDDYQRGYTRGVRLGDRIRSRYETMILTPVLEGTLRPKEEPWQYWPPTLDPVPLAIPALATRARAGLRGIGDSAFASLQGTARGANIPFDAYWLLQYVDPMGLSEEPILNVPSSLGIQVVAVGDRAGGDGVLMGLNFDWPAMAWPVVATETPATGHAFVHVGFDWQSGVLAGINDVGVAVAIAALPARNDDTNPTLPLELALRDVLQHTNSFDSAVAYLREHAEHIRGRVLISGDSKDGWKAAMLILGTTVSLRAEEDELILGADSGQDNGAVAARGRYQFIRDALVDERILGVSELQGLLTVRNAQVPDNHGIWGDNTRYSVILLPEKRTIHLATSDAAGNPGAYTTYTLAGGTVNE